MPKALIPAQLQEIIDTHKALFGGFQMMADDPAATPPPQAPQEPAQQPETGQPDDYRGAGSKDALKADLATERDKRQALEQQVAELNDRWGSLAGIFGAKPEALTPEQMAQQITDKDAQLEAKDNLISERDRRLAVYEQAPDGINVRRLLDSRRFESAIAQVDLSSPEAVSQAITQFLNDNPDYRSSHSSGGDLHAGHGRTPENVAPGVDRMAAALEQTLRKN